ncbi:MFS transporter [Nocardioides sp. AX2bis]|uniref:MFS transporter n=1 Tax=Nocardioides sp. AX2bis TaxID=2653157 RepID=UPI0012F14D4B|nr:MFS transporter [Nocardioides sp. AX2bis]VXB21232.1 Cyanate permease [Nocardioides sp. AX2bis]
MSGSRTGVRPVVVVFIVNGLLMASLFSRVPDVRRGLDLANGPLGLLLLCAAVGSVLSLPTAGRLIQSLGVVAVLRAGALTGVVGLVVLAVAVDLTGSVPLAAAGLLAVGVGIGLWDVAMNAEGAEVERDRGRTLMPRLHAGFSIGSVAGALLGAVALWADLPVLPHLGVACALALAASWWATAAFAPAPARAAAAGEGVPSALGAWTEPRTLVIGLMVLCFAVAEGSANDWLSLALIDGHGAADAVGVAGFALFVAAMTAGRVLGPPVLDRWGRPRVLAAGAATAGAGVLLVVLAGSVVAVAVGIVLWGLGAALGFPVGMSAAADDPRHAAARLSVVSTIGYAAFLAGPPLLGWLGDAVGTLQALLVVAALMGPALLTVLATRPEPVVLPDRAAR